MSNLPPEVEEADEFGEPDATDDLASVDAGGPEGEVEEAAF